MKTKRLIKLLALISCMAMIFYFSSRVDIESDKQSNGLMIFLYNFYKLFGKLSLQDYLDAYGFYVRKLAHFSEFALLGLLAYLNIEEYYQDNNFILSLILCFTYATSDEIHQLFVPGRACSFKDILIDTYGSLFMIIICHLLKKRWKED